MTYLFSDDWGDIEEVGGRGEGEESDGVSGRRQGSHRRLGFATGLGDGEQERGDDQTRFGVASPPLVIKPHLFRSGTTRYVDAKCKGPVLIGPTFPG